jgi:hypothetical protein
VYCGQPAGGGARSHRSCREAWQADHDPGTVKAILLGRTGPVCAGCRRMFPAPQLQDDHIVPLADGGRDVLDNRQLLCGRCHGNKSAREARDRAARQSPTGEAMATSKATGRPARKTAGKPAAEVADVPDRAAPVRLATGAALLAVAGVAWRAAQHGVAGVRGAGGPLAVVAAGWLAAAVAGCCWQEVRWRRRQAVARLRGLAVDVTMSRPEECAARVRRWARWCSSVPADFTVGYSPRFADSDLSAQARLVAFFEEKTGALRAGYRLVGTWWPERDTVRLRRVLREDADPARETGNVEPEKPADEQQQAKLKAEMAAYFRSPEFDLTVHSKDGRGIRSFTIRYPTGWPDHMDERRAELLLKIGAKMAPERWSAAWTTQAHKVRFTRRPDMPKIVPLPQADQSDLMRFRLAIDEQGKPVFWDAGVPLTPHCLVVGSTGGGKTTVLANAIITALAKGWQVLIIDGKGTSLVPFEKWPGVVACGFGEPKEMAAVLTRAARTMRDRYAQVRSGKARVEDFTPVLVVVDELSEVVATITRDWKDSRRQGTPKALEDWHSIGRLGRESNLHLLVGVQQGSAKVFDGTEVRDQYGFRIALGPLSQEAARMTFGDSSIGRDVPMEPPGRATVGVQRKAFEAQACFMPKLAVGDAVPAEYGPFLAAARRHHDPADVSQPTAPPVVVAPDAVIPGRSYTDPGSDEPGRVWVVYEVEPADGGGADVTLYDPADKPGDDGAAPESAFMVGRSSADVFHLAPGGAE